MNKPSRQSMKALIPHSIQSLSAALRVMRDQTRLAVWAGMGLLIPAVLAVCAVLLWKFGRLRKHI